MIKTLTINDLKKELHKKDGRSIIRWCKKNSIEIFDNGRDKFIYAVEFYNVLHKNLFSYLIQKFGNKASEALVIYLNNDITGLSMLKDETKSLPSISNGYIPQNSREKELLAEFNKRKTA